MNEAILQLKFPQTLVKDLWQDKIKAAKEAKRAYVFYLFQQKLITSRKAAQLLEMSWSDFLEIMRQYHIPYFDYTPDELDRAQKNLSQALNLNK